jgi:predicted chitinase
MSGIKITGNTEPLVGKQELYTINGVLGNVMQQNLLMPKKTDNPFENMTKWSVHVLENGKWRKTEGNDKTGETAQYTFNQKSLERKGIKLVAERGDEHASITITPQKAEVAKITKVEILDAGGKTPTKPFAYGQTLIARTHCVHMELRPVTVTLWEDDATGAGHNTINNKNKIQTKTNSVFKGIVDIPFLLTPDAAKIANAMKAKGDSSEGKTHEYYITAEIYAKEPKKIASANVMANNPDYNHTTAKKPAPAEKKGKSKKEEKGIGETIIDGIHDWFEETVKVSPIILPSPTDIINSVMKIFTPDGKEENEKKEKKVGDCFCNRDITILELKNAGVSENKATEFLEAINKTFTDYNINTCLRKAHFLAQIIHESGGFRYTEELHVADTAYHGYKGRGLVQLTGRTNYEEYGRYEGENFTSSLENKNKLKVLPYAARSAGWFWTESAKLNDDADLNDHINITRIINGGFNGYNDRTKNIKKGFAVFYENCKNDTGKNTNFEFNLSKAYNNKRGAFAWGLWHDPDLRKDGCTKDKEKAIAGYSRFIELAGDHYNETNWYNILDISSFHNLIYIVHRKSYIKVIDAAKQRLESLK